MKRALRGFHPELGEFFRRRGVFLREPFDKGGCNPLKGENGKELGVGKRNFVIGEQLFSRQGTFAEPDFKGIPEPERLAQRCREPIVDLIELDAPVVAAFG